MSLSGNDGFGKGDRRTTLEQNNEKSAELSRNMREKLQPR